MGTHACISLRQPYATLIALGVKTYETRARNTTYRGPLLIHASSGLEGWQREGFEALDGLLGMGDLVGYDRLEDMPRGVIVGQAVLADTFTTERARVRRPEQEIFCDFSDGRFAYQMDDARLIKSDTPVKGQLGIFHVEFDVDDVLKAAA
jgi:hypothetical protein